MVPFGRSERRERRGSVGSGGSEQSKRKERSEGDRSDHRTRVKAVSVCSKRRAMSLPGSGTSSFWTKLSMMSRAEQYLKALDSVSRRSGSCASARGRWRRGAETLGDVRGWGQGGAGPARGGGGRRGTRVACPQTRVACLRTRPQYGSLRPSSCTPAYRLLALESGQCGSVRANMWAAG